MALFASKFQNRLSFGGESRFFSAQVYKFQHSHSESDFLVLEDIKDICETGWHFDGKNGQNTCLLTEKSF